MSSGITDDPDSECLGHGVDEHPVPQNECYLVLSAAERAKGYVRPVRRSYVHAKSLGGCGAVTRMGQELAETYARQPSFYGSTYCVGCAMHRRVGEAGEFFWDGTAEKVGT